MIETYRMLGSEHDADLAREAEKRRRGSLVHVKTKGSYTMSKKLITTIVLVVAVASVGASRALADPPPTRAENGQGASGVCHMLNVDGSAVGMAGMNNSAHGNGYDNMANDLIIPACF